MDIDIINIREVKDQVNCWLYDWQGVGLEELKKSNEIIEKVGGFINETIINYNNI